MGWRSQEHLRSTPSAGSLVSTPAQRLASSALRPQSASSVVRKKVTISDYGDFYKEKRESKPESKQDNSALHESIKQVCKNLLTQFNELINNYYDVLR